MFQQSSDSVVAVIPASRRAGHRSRGTPGPATARGPAVRTRPRAARPPRRSQGQGVAGEEQTHTESYPLPDLLAPDAPPNLVVESGPMSEHLRRARGFVTISSTAVLEARALGIPSILLDDFGVDASLINEVFADSGLLALSSDLIALLFSPWERLLAGRELRPPGLGQHLRAQDDRPFRGSGQRATAGSGLSTAKPGRCALVAFLIGWPAFALRRARRARLIAHAEMASSQR
jgi:hypothetical protein